MPTQREGEYNMTSLSIEIEDMKNEKKRAGHRKYRKNSSGLPLTHTKRIYQK